jgi:surface polysaccharide O-acyltransferase-like enzyme
MPGTSTPAPAPELTVDALVDATPARRDRVVDLLRAVSIAVVVLWHWTFSITQWRHGSLRMPNPIADVPGLWTATWLLQVMPLFFLVGGYANQAGWDGVVRARALPGGASPARAFWAKRVSRLVRPVAVYVGCWTVFDLAWQASGGRSVLDWGMVVFVPLWFLGVYVGVVALVPVTAQLHARHRRTTLVALGAGILLADLVRLGGGIEAVGLLGSALVWIFCHQLGYVWRDWTTGVRRGGPASLLVAGGLGALVALTQFGPYSRSMVAVRGEDVSNMFPTTACIAALAVFQLGLVLLARAPLTRWLQRRRVWRTVVAANGVAMTVFCWHMTALVAFLLAYQAAGFTLATKSTAGWWLTRPVWIAGPAVLLAGLLAVFARFELPTRPKSRR